MRPRSLQYSEQISLSPVAAEGFSQDCESLQKLFGGEKVTILGIQGYPDEFYTELESDDAGSYLVIFFRVGDVTYQIDQKYIYYKTLNDGKAVYSYRLSIYRPRKKRERNPFGQAAHRFLFVVNGKSAQNVIFPEGVHAFPIAELLKSVEAIETLRTTISGFTHYCIERKSHTATPEFAADVLSALRRKPGFMVVEFEN